MTFLIRLFNIWIYIHDVYHIYIYIKYIFIYLYLYLYIYSNYHVLMSKRYFFEGMFIWFSKTYSFNLILLCFLNDFLLDFNCYNFILLSKIKKTLIKK